MTITRDFERCQCFNFEASFLKNENIFKKLEYRFYLKVLLFKVQHFHKKLNCQKPVLRQIESGVQNRHIRNNEDLPLNTYFF